MNNTPSTSQLPHAEQKTNLEPPSGTNRRIFLSRALGAGGGLLILGTAGCAEGDGQSSSTDAQNTAQASIEQAPALPNGKVLEDFILHSERPLAIETKRNAFGTSGIVPHELLYIRNNLPMPDPSFVEDRDGWELAVEGVKNPRTVTVGELKGMGLETIAVVLQCSGNGRTFFEHGASGSQWGVGAAGCVVWSGVPVRIVAEELGGVVDGTRFVTGTGGEELPEGLDPKQVVVERSVPLEKGMKDALLAWEMNGKPIPLAHGGPLRLIVPGYYGCNQIKYIKRLGFTPEISDATIMQTGYRVRPIGKPGDPSQPTMWDMNVKSWINHPSGDGGALQPGLVQIDGVAFGGDEALDGVEVSLDGGQTWEVAQLIGPDLGRYAWRQFVFPATLETGTYTLASRATDASGNTQPAERMENERGYGDNSWRDHAVQVIVG